VPTLCLEHLSEAQKRAYILADNRLAQNAGWDRELVGLELQGLVALVLVPSFKKVAQIVGWKLFLKQVRPCDIVLIGQLLTRTTFEHRI
jgi:hypothetical protein